jgi:hypothetical protein
LLPCRAISKEAFRQSNWNPMVRFFKQLARPLKCVRVPDPARALLTSIRAFPFHVSAEPSSLEKT